jgi:glutamyl/glutaminyl-tRNA synthetase
MLVPIVMERIEKFSDVAAMAEKGELSFFFEQPTIDIQKLIFKDSTAEEARKNLETVRELLGSVAEEDWDITMIKDSVMKFADTLPKRGPALHPLRYALSGREQSPDPFTIASIIGKEETLSRIEKAANGL